MAESVAIAQGWRLADFAPGDGLSAGAQRTDFDDAGWLQIDVPGDVHRALIDAGRIPDPYYDRNESACAWMEQREWWYRVTFDASALPPSKADERLLLVFDGLDTFATIYLNEQQLGEHHNMFRPAEFDVTRPLQSGRNVLAVRFDPPLQRIAGKKLSAWGRNPERTAMRKAQFGFGWDWGPRLPTIGVWRPVRLVHQQRAAIRAVHFATLDLRRDHRQAAVTVRVEVERFATDGPLRAHIRLTDAEGHSAAESKVVFDTSAVDRTAYLTVDRPRLWWTHELGEPTLYTLSVALTDAKDNQLDETTARAGIRTLVLDQSPDPAEPGTRFFRFVLNGRPLFAKGANWIPSDAFVGAISPAHLATLLQLARDANMTMLRIWGGGIYEDDHFYAECDRLGVLVWQDFMFACAMYDDEDADLLAEIDAEAQHQVRRLRNHPSLAVWCGNNENQWLHERKFWDHHPLPRYGQRIYDEILPRVVAELDGRTPYWPGSPFGGNDHNSELEGDTHNWNAWHGNFPRQFGEAPRNEQTPETVSFLRYAEDSGRFISEFGLHAVPDMHTLERVIPADQRFINIHSPALDWHNKDNPKNKGDNLLSGITGLPEDLEQYITYSQIAQAEGLKFGIEHFRRRTPHCSGALVWQLNDCWPALSWSVIDYYCFLKAGYFYVRRAFAPLLASFKTLECGDVELWLTNDLPDDVTDALHVRCGTFSARTLWEETLRVVIKSGESRAVGRWTAQQIGAAPDRYLSVHAANTRVPPNRLFFAPYKDLERVRHSATLTIRHADQHRIIITLHAPADGYVYFAHVRTPHASTRYSDNYVDLEPGEARDIVITDETRMLTADQLTLGSA